MTKPTTPSSPERSRAAIVARSVRPHVILVLLAGAAAAWVWSREKAPEGTAKEATVWGGHGDDVKTILIEMKNKKVMLQAKSEGGRWFLGTVEKDKVTPPPPPPSASGSAAAPAPPPPTDGKQKTLFAGGSAAQKVADKLAPLKAIRAFGKLADDKLADFGLKDADETLTVRVGGADHKLLIGSPIPGSSDRYVMDPVSREVYVVHGDVVYDVESADWRLAEHEQHEWKEQDIAKAAIKGAGAVRQMVRSGAEGKRFWADRTSPDKNDETLSNYMQKVDRLRGQEFVETLPPGSQPVVQIFYDSASTELGRFELFKTASQDPQHKFDYWYKTELSHLLFVKAPAAAAEQLDQDLASVMH